MEEIYSESEVIYSFVTYPEMDHCSRDNHTSIHSPNHSSNVKYSISNCVHISKILQRKNTRSCAPRCSVIGNLTNLIVLSFFLIQACTVKPVSGRSMITVLSPDPSHNQLTSTVNHNSAADVEKFTGNSQRSQEMYSNRVPTSDVYKRQVSTGAQSPTRDVLNVVSSDDVRTSSSSSNGVQHNQISPENVREKDVRQEFSSNIDGLKSAASNTENEQVSSSFTRRSAPSHNIGKEHGISSRRNRETSRGHRKRLTASHYTRDKPRATATSSNSGGDSDDSVRENDLPSSAEDESRGLPLWSLQEQEVLKQRILDGLGMESAPPRHIYNVTKEEFDAAYAEYLQAVAMEEAREEEMAEARYRRLYPDEVDDDLDDDEAVDGGPVENGDDSSALAEYKFFSTRIKRPSRGRGRRSLANGDRIAHFHVSVPMSADDIQVVWAKATFFKKGNSKPGPDDPKTVSMQLYRVDDIKKSRAKRKTGQLGKDKLLQTFNLTVDTDETLEVNMTEAVKSWLESSKSDTGVLIRCPDCLAAGVQIRTGGTSHVPTLHVQTRLSATKRVKRSRDMRRATRAKWRQLGDCKDGPLNGRHSSRCCRRSMTVRFDDLPGFDFIAAPKEFDAYYCSGKCPPRYNPANEHALLQSLINMQKKKDVPRPCCAPTDLKGLYILHYDHSGKLKTELWRDVIVTECGCT